MKFLFITACFLLTIINRNNINNKDVTLLRLGMFFTVLADFCLIIINKYVLGISLFCIVQQIHNIRYTNNKRAKILFFILIIIFAVLKFIETSELYLCAILYALCLIFSVSGAIVALKNKKYPKINGIMITIGMILFLLCDINVGLFNLDLKFNKNVFHFFIWLFYVPSQICLAMSGRKYGKKIAV